MRARLCWLLDKGSASHGTLVAAASALLCPGAAVSLTDDPVLAERAAAALLTGGVPTAWGGGIKKRPAHTFMFVPLAEGLLRWARPRRRGGSRGEHSGHEDGTCDAPAAVIPVVRGTAIPSVLEVSVGTDRADLAAKRLHHGP